jgi:hypothetical protein
MSWRSGSVHPPHMDALSLLILAIGSLAFLDIAAANLRGPERTTRSTRSTRARR